MLTARTDNGCAEARSNGASGREAADRVEVGHQGRQLATLAVLVRRSRKLGAPTAENHRQRASSVGISARVDIGDRCLFRVPAGVGREVPEVVGREVPRVWVARPLRAAAWPFSA